MVEKKCIWKGRGELKIEGTREKLIEKAWEFARLLNRNTSKEAGERRKHIVLAAMSRTPEGDGNR